MIHFNQTELIVSPICLGTATYGTGVSIEDAHRQLDTFFELGGNFIDTAHMYGDWGDQGSGLSERIIGQWMKERGNREKVVIATKGSHPKLGFMETPRLDSASIRSDLEGSLTCLNTSYIDLYFLHRDDPSMPVGEILQVLEEARLQGKIRYYGCSNWSLPRIKEAHQVAKRRGFQGFICNQLMWSLADISTKALKDKTMHVMNRETYDYHKEKNWNAMAYTSIAKGYFLKVFSKVSVPVPVDEAMIYHLDSNADMAEVLRDYLPAGYSVLDICLLYFQDHSFPAVPIAGFSKLVQMKTAMKSIGKTVPGELFHAIGILKKFTQP